MKKKLLCILLAVTMLSLIMAIPASAASATLNKGDISAWTGKVVGTQAKLTTAINYPDSARKVYFDFKYYNGSSWVKDKNAAGLAVNTSIASTIYSNKKSASMTWAVQINTWNCLYTDGHAYGVVIV